MTDLLNIEIEELPATPGVIVVHFQGALESDTINTIEKVFTKVQGGKSVFAIADMSGATLVSSAALGELMGARKRLNDAGGDLVLAGVILEIRTKLNLMGASKIFKMFNDVRSAVNAYKWEKEKKPEQVDLTFPSNLKMVPAVRQLVSRIARQKGYGNRDAFRIETIVDEICNNAVEHGLNGSNHEIGIKVSIDPDKIEIDVTNISDPDKMFLLRSHLKPDEHLDVKHDDKRGRGLMLIKMLTDELTFNTSEHGTVVHVKKVREE
jgi:anti-anti-sigma factor